MGKKKEVIGNTIEVELPPPPAEAPKKKREMTEKQRENLSKGMAILKAKREAKSKKDDEPEPPAPPPPPPPPPPAPAPAPPPPAPEQPKKERKPRVVKNYLTTEDFNSFKTELLTTLRPNKDPQPSAAVRVDTVPTYSPITKERVISGSELLNKLFFNN
jgi:hypothetical protein